MTPAEIRARREALGLTQQQLADRLGVHRVAVARWESTAGNRDSRREPPAYLALALAQLEAQRNETAS